LRNLIIVGAVCAALGFVAGAAFWYLASPLWTIVEVSEALSAAGQAAELARGDFAGVDAVHQGSGTASVYRGADGELTLRLTDFSVTNGPDLKVWLVKAGAEGGVGDPLRRGYLALGPLKGNLGDQNYLIPAGTQISDYGAVLIWCEQFSFLFAAAELTPADP
jgi:hypothetical protein